MISLTHLLSLFLLPACVSVLAKFLCIAEIATYLWMTGFYSFLKNSMTAKKNQCLILSKESTIAILAKKKNFSAQKMRKKIHTFFQLVSDEDETSWIPSTKNDR